jgi:hypothetical protein
MPATYAQRQALRKLAGYQTAGYSVNARTMNVLEREGWVIAGTVTVTGLIQIRLCPLPVPDGPGVCGNEINAGATDCGAHRAQPEPCPVCVYGEPTRHTCDAGQQARYAIEIRSAYSPH